jgi:catechol 2,3-dioxygenase-like lactoylglutathione lyase family enzyme
VTLSAPQVILFTADVDRAARFYRGLGFTETFRATGPDGGAIHVDLELDGYRIGFALLSSARDDHGLDPVEEGQRATLTLWADDVRAEHDRLTAAGVPSLAAPRVWLDRLLVAWLRDPDGHPLQLCQRLG